ncbi:MAG: DUF4199 domain-containing protein [Muribaculaceae bacterium]|nr:DUF4199 domain-containing protein [Muribaculaceae bacterium]
MAPTVSNVFRRAADQGLILGGCLTALFVLMALSARTALAGLLAVVLILAVPVLVYVLLRRSYEADHRETSLSALCTQGIYTFLFGSLLMAMCAYLYLKFVEPQYALTRMEDVVSVGSVSDSPYLRDMAEQFRSMIDRGMIPGAKDIAMSLFWCAAFTGSVLAILVSLLIKMVAKPTNKH